LCCRRSTGFVTYTADQVHLLPGFPLQIVSKKYPVSSLVARIAIYVKFPPGVVLESDSALSVGNLLKIVTVTQQQIENALNVSILEIAAHRFEPAKEPSTDKEPLDIKYIIIGAVVGGVVLVLLVILIYV